MQAVIAALDEAIREAAKIEGKDHLYRQFADVFGMQNYDDGSGNVQYIPSLWRGYMSAPNYQYCVSVQQLKSLIIQAINEHNCSTLAALKHRISDVWNGICKEDFVFSFQNTTETRLFNAFMSSYREMVVPIRTAVLEKRLEASQNIENAESEKDIHRLQDKYIRDIKNILNEKCNEVLQDIGELIQDDTYRCVLKHKCYFISDLRAIEAEISSNVISELEHFADLSRRAKRKDPIVETITSEFKTKISVIADDLRKRLTSKSPNDSSGVEELVGKTFEEYWEQMIKHIRRDPVRSLSEITKAIHATILQSVQVETKGTRLMISIFFKDKKIESYANSSICVYEDFSMIEKIKSLLSSDLDQGLSTRITKLTDEICSLSRKGDFKENVPAVLATIQSFLESEKNINIGDAIFLGYSLSHFIALQYNFQREKEVDRIMTNRKLYEHCTNKDLLGIQQMDELLKSKLYELMPTYSFSQEQIYYIKQHIKLYMHDNTDEYVVSKRKKNIERTLELFTLGFLKYTKKQFPVGKLRDFFISEYRKLIPEKIDICICNPKYVELYVKLILHLTADMKLESDHDLAIVISFALQIAYSEFYDSLRMHLAKMVRGPRYRSDHVSSLNEMVGFVLSVAAKTLSDNSDNKRFLALKESFNEENVFKYHSLAHSLHLLKTLDVKLLSMLPEMSPVDTAEVLRSVNKTKLTLLSHQNELAPFNATFFANELAKIIQHNVTQTFTNEIKSAIVVHIGAWVIPICAVDQYRYEQSKNMATLVQNEKDKLFTSFKIMCSDTSDEIVADEFCTSLKGFLKSRVQVKALSELVIRLSTDYKEFQQKRYLIGTILHDLCDRDSFQEIVQFLQSFETFSKKWILDRIAAVCNSGDENTLLQRCYQESLNTLFHQALDSIDAVGKLLQRYEYDKMKSFSNWLDKFCEYFKTSSFLDFDTQIIRDLPVNSLKTFQGKCYKMFRNMKPPSVDELYLPPIGDADATKAWLLNAPIKIHEDIFSFLKDCSEQCPFCGAVCDHTLKEHSKHMSVLHYPLGINGRRCIFTQKLSTDICTSLVKSDKTYILNSKLSRPYKEYENDHPDWYIRDVSGIKPTDFWKFIFAKYNEQFADRHGCKMGDIPREWNEITKPSALKSVKEAHNLILKNPALVTPCKDICVGYIPTYHEGNRSDFSLLETYTFLNYMVDM